MSEQVDLEKAIKERELELKKMAEKLAEFTNTYHDLFEQNSTLRKKVSELSEKEQAKTKVIVQEREDIKKIRQELDVLERVIRDQPRPAS